MSKKLSVENMNYVPRTSFPFPLTFPFFHPPGLIINCPLSIINYQLKKTGAALQSRSHCYKR